MKRDTDDILRQCLHPGSGAPQLRRMPPDMRRAREHMEKATANLRAMRVMFDNEIFDWTVVCGYYAMYHAALAALARIGSGEIVSLP